MAKENLVSDYLLQTNNNSIMTESARSGSICGFDFCMIDGGCAGDVCAPDICGSDGGCSVDACTGEVCASDGCNVDSCTGDMCGSDGSCTIDTCSSDTCASDGSCYADACSHDTCFTDSVVVIKINPWSWTSSNGSATDAQTQMAYTAITGKGAVSNFSYLVWNDLIDKVQEAKDIDGYSWNTKYLSLSNTKMTSSDKTLTAARFNSVRYNIGIHVSTGISDVSIGDTVYGSYFTTLTNSLNTWIDTINNS